jgi:hypothetical protein
MTSPMQRLFWLGVISALFFLSVPSLLAADKIDPEIVRVSYVQGDVRFSRGDGKNPDLNKSWEQAQANVPIERGYSVATGAGRAEIEFENGSMVYLAENSVLLFNVLDVRSGLPVSVIELLTGTATFNVQPVPGELFRVNTPSGGVYFTDRSYVRVDSFLDGVVVSPADPEGETLHPAAGRTLHLAKGQSITYEDGRPAQLGRLGDSTAAADWDAWVDARVKEKGAATTAGLAASGLSAPIPGLADLYEGGKFFACAPYGKCWEPNGESEPAGIEDQQDAATPQAQQGSSTDAQAKQTGTPARRKVQSYYYPSFTCPPLSTRVDTVTDPVTGKEKVVNITEEGDPWTWGLCHSGSWIHWHGSYVWVAGRKRHHPPIRWVYAGNTTGYVPRHPNDVSGKRPINLKYGILAPTGDAGRPIERVDFSDSQRIKILNATPKEFRDQKSPELAHAEQPAIQARLLADARPGAALHAGVGQKDLNQRAGGMRPAISYDYKTRQFQRAAGSGDRAGKPVVMGNVSPRGDFSSASNGHGSGGGASGAGSAGHSSSAGGSSSGGGIRVSGGGGSSGASGGKHG